MALAELVRDLPGSSLQGGDSRPVVDVTLDSRAVGDGWLFAAVDGVDRDGRDFVPDAVARGACAVMARGPRPSDLPDHVAWLSVDDPRARLGPLARRLHGEPDQALAVAGITGTDGKTTTAHLLAAALEAAGRPTAIGGTLGQRFRELETETTLTTPEAPELYRFLAQARRDGAQAVVLEVSSAGLAARRTDGLRFRTAVLTGIGRDHLDLHGSVEAYAAAKRRLFDGLDADAVAILPAEDEWTPDFRRACPAERQQTFGSVPEADWLVGEVSLTGTGSAFDISGPGLSRRIVSWPRTAAWDARNLAAAVAAAAALGASPETALTGALHAGPVPGRWEPVHRGQGFRVIVDYAHTPRALERALAAARRESAGRVILVFGCGGDRDRDKRPEMGRLAAQAADLVIVTDDNPRREDPETIAAEIIEGAPRDRARIERIADRRRAIAEAVAAAEPGDLVLVAGRGHERLQKVGERLIPLDDRGAVIEALEAREAGR